MKELSEIFNRNARQNFELPVGKRLKFVNFFVSFVPDFSDEFFKNVLHRNDSGRFSVFVDGDYHVGVLSLHIFEKSVKVNRFRNEGGLMKNHFEIKARILSCDEIISCVKNSDNLVNVVLNDGHS